MLDEVFENEIIDSMEERAVGKWVECMICGEKYYDDGEESCCMIDS